MIIITGPDCIKSPPIPRITPPQFGLDTTTGAAHMQQQPTCTGLRVRTPADAHVIFHAVSLNLLPMVSRRLDTEERRAISSGCVYVWEERGPNAEATGVRPIRLITSSHYNNHPVSAGNRALDRLHSMGPKPCERCKSMQQPLVTQV